MNIVKLKKQMREYARKHDLSIPSIAWDSGVWGLGARTLAWRVSGDYGTATTDAKRLWLHFNPPLTPHIEDHHLAFSGLGHRAGAPRRIVWHNSGSSTGTVEAFHAYHKSLGWAGVAYHYIVYKDGRIVKGRPDWAMGGHCYMNNDTIGVCFVGNYESSDRVMPAKQLAAGKALHKYLHHKYACGDSKHKDMPNNSTSCPGKYLPYREITSYS